MYVSSRLHVRCADDAASRLRHPAVGGVVSGHITFVKGQQAAHPAPGGKSLSEYLADLRSYL